MIFVGIGGFFGAICRYLIGQWLTPTLQTHFPLTTWLINISGSLALGIFAKIELPTSIYLLMTTGFLGAYTTFSTFGYETIQLWQSKRYKTAAIYVMSSIIIGIIAAAIGYYCAYPFS